MKENEGHVWTAGYLEVPSRRLEGCILEPQCQLVAQGELEPLSWRRTTWKGWGPTVQRLAQSLWA